MNEKILIYIVVAIGYYLYTRYQKLQQEALERKKGIEFKSDTRSIVIKPVEEIKVPRQPMSKNVLVRTNIGDQRKENKFIKENTFEKSQTSIKQISQESKMALPQNQNVVVKDKPTESAIELDLERMVIYSVIFREPAYLKY